MGISVGLPQLLRSFTTVKHSRHVDYQGSPPTPQGKDFGFPLASYSMVSFHTTVIVGKKKKKKNSQDGSSASLG